MCSMDSQKRAHAVALFSGGLDSTLAIILMLRQDIKVTALKFMIPSGCDLEDHSSSDSNPYPAAQKFGFDVKLIHLGQKFVDIVQNPRFGYGRYMNPCIDCRILMLNEARTFMEMINADFVITGEVLGQRPMSQRRDNLKLVIREAGLKGRLLRPLSARLLPPTEPELSDLIDREKLEGISGRSRKRQMELAEQFGLEDFTTPAGGCLLTDENYSNRLRDLLAHTEQLAFNDLNLLRVGRYFRLDDHTILIVGRHEKDNQQIELYRQNHHCVIEAVDVGSPLTLLIGDTSEENIKRAAMITARYSAARNEPEVRVACYQPSHNINRELMVAPILDEHLAQYRIH